MKKTYFAAVLTVFLIVLLTVTAMAAPAVEGDFTFDNSTGTITKYNGTGGDVVIPATIGGSSVTSIGNYAFSECASLASVTVLATTPPSLGISVFEEIPQTAVLYVPKGCAAAYQSSAWQTYFKVIVEPVELPYSFDFETNPFESGWMDVDRDVYAKWIPVESTEEDAEN